MGAAAWEIRQRLQTAATNVSDGVVTYTLIAANIKLGYDELAADNTLLSSLSSNPYLQIGPAELLKNDLNSGTSDYEIPWRMWLTIARETDNTFVTIEKLLDALKTGWINYEMSWARTLTDVKKTPALVRYEGKVLALGC